MHSNWQRRALVLAVFGLIPLGGSPARANGHFSSWFAPTNYVEVVPSSYVVPTYYTLPSSYVATSYYVAAPTSYVVPTSYVSTDYAYVTPTNYVETAWTSPTVYVPTYYSTVASSYVVPTSYYYPTVGTSYVVPASYYYPTVETSYVIPAVYSPTLYTPTTWTPTYYTAPTVAVASASPCETTSGTPRYGRGYHPSETAKSTPKPPPPPVLESIPEEGSGSSKGNADTSSRAGGGTGSTTTKDSLPAPAKPSGGAADSGTPPPPNAPEIGGEKNPTPITDLGAGRGSKAGDAAKSAEGAKSPEGAEPATLPPAPRVPPVAPSGDTPAPATLPNPADSDLRRTSQRPVLGARSKPYVRTTARGDLNLLEGIVKSGTTGQPVAGVQVIISNTQGGVPDRVASSDASGRYAVRVPDGEWEVKVPSTTGQVYAVRGLTVSNGQIVDDQGRDIPTLTITR